jgi:proton-dependent oligopeptide transporter, POT family
VHSRPSAQPVLATDGQAARIPLRQPASLRANALAQGAWYFARYGAQSIIVLYLVHALLPRAGANGSAVLGLATAERWLGLAGAAPSVIAPALVGITALLDIPAQIAGGVLGDLCGRRRAALAGVLLMVIANLLLCFDRTALLATLCDMLGGALAINLFAALGDLYTADDPRRADAFRLTALAQDVATVLGPLICGGVAARFGWHAGFAVAATILAAGAVCYRVGAGPLPIASKARMRIDARGGLRLAALALLLPVLALAALGNEQIYDTYPLWAEQHADLHVAGHLMPAGWLLSLDAAVSIMMQVAVTAFWRAWARRRTPPGELAQIASFAWIAPLGPLLLCLASMLHSGSGAIGFGWLIAFHILNDTAMAVVQPGGMALFAHESPAAFRGTVMAVYVTSDRLADGMAGRLGAALPHLGSADFWLAHAGLIALGALCLTLAARLLHHLFAGR